MLVSLLPVCARNCFLPSESPVKETFPSLLRADPTPKRGQNISEEGEVKKKKEKRKKYRCKKSPTGFYFKNTSHSSKGSEQYSRATFTEGV